MLSSCVFVLVLAGTVSGLIFSRPSTFRRELRGLRYDDWEVDIESVESRRDAPLVSVKESSISGGGLGVFLNQDVSRGQTLTEWVGLLSPTPRGAFEEVEILQSYYGSEWRGLAQRYEIGLSGTRVVDAAGMALGGAVRLSLAEDEETLLETADQVCLIDEDPSACAVRAGEAEYILLGKTADQGACPREGVAQLINDHSAVVAPPVPNPFLHLATAKSAATKDGAYAPRHVDGFLHYESTGIPVAADFEALHASSLDYIQAILPKNNVALVQADIGPHANHNHAPRIFAVATRDLKAGSELFYSYGLTFWLAFLRSQALAQLVVCGPKPARANAVADLIRAIEHTSRNLIQAEAKAIKQAACMPSRYVQPLEPLPPLDDLLDPDSWQFAVLQEQLSLNTECPLELDPSRLSQKNLDNDIEKAKRPTSSSSPS